MTTCMSCGRELIGEDVDWLRCVRCEILRYESLWRRLARRAEPLVFVAVYCAAWMWVVGKSMVGRK